MSNTELTKHYIQMPPMQGQLPNTDPANIMQAIDAYCKGQWSWEVTNESFALDNTIVCTTVMVYMPGRILTGRAISPSKEYGQNHLRALANACQLIMTAKPSIQAPNSAPQPQGNMSPSEIMGMINNAPTSSQTPPTQAPIQKPADDESDLPFYFGSEQNTTQTNSIPPMQSSQSNVLNLFDGVDDVPNGLPQEHHNEEPEQALPHDYDEPKPYLNGFSQRQVDGVNAFKAKLDVVNDTMFCNYINAWNSNFTSKAQLTPQNVDDFLKWASKLPVGEGVR